MNSVTLTASELTTAAMIGVRRQVQNLVRGRQDAHGRGPEDGWTPHIEGACGEMAVAKWMGLYWSGNMGELAADDVGGLQVRTASAVDSRLIVHPSDPDDRVFVLVTGRAPNFVLQGWLMGRDAKDPAFWVDPGTGRPAFFVPLVRLMAIERLKHMPSRAAAEPGF